MPKNMEVASAFVPGHITGLFAIRDSHDNPMFRGSIGAGFSVSVGTTTEVQMNRLDRLEVVVEYNGTTIDARVTKTVVQQLAGHINDSFALRVSHDSELPIGVGFGASGAGALGAALAFAAITGLEKNHATQAAHYAEVVNHAGLGDVLAQYHGGIEIRTKPGAPGIGTVKTITADEPYCVILAGASGIDTKDILTDPVSRRSINQHGEHLVSKLLEEPTLNRLIQYSRTFAESSGLMTDRVQSALDDLDQIGLQSSSMVMLGDSVFCVCHEDEVVAAKDSLEQYWHPSEIIETSFATEGGRLNP